MVHIISDQETIEKILSGELTIITVEDDADYWAPGKKLDFWDNDPYTNRKVAVKLGMADVTNSESYIIRPAINTVLHRDKFSGFWSQVENLHDFSVMMGFKNWLDLRKKYRKDAVIKILTFQLIKN